MQNGPVVMAAPPVSLLHGELTPTVAGMVAGTVDVDTEMRGGKPGGQVVQPQRKVATL